MSSLKTKTLIEYLKRFQPGAIAFSGGVDSTLLLYLAREAWTASPLAISFVSPLLTPKERERIKILGKLLNISPSWLKTREYLDSDFIRNTPSRCYYCKRSRLKQARPFLAGREIKFILDGTNADDLRTHRPGIRASKEARVISPFASLGWTKQDIRKVSWELDLPTWNQPSSPCLATRIIYGQKVTLSLLKRLAQGEEALHQMGFEECRLRVHHNLVRIEIPEKQISSLMNPLKKSDLINRLSALGFTYLTVDLQGFRSGSMDEGLKDRKKTIAIKNRIV
jgi:uncharacterized protein